MKLEINVPASQVAAIETIIKVLCDNETGDDNKLQECLDSPKLMGIVHGIFVKRIVLWSKKMDALARIKAKSKTSELSKLKALVTTTSTKSTKTTKTTKTSKKKSSKPAATASDS
jgi:hypothetical protein